MDVETVISLLLIVIFGMVGVAAIGIAGFMYLQQFFGLEPRVHRHRMGPWQIETGDWGAFTIRRCKVEKCGFYETCNHKTKPCPCEDGT